MTIKDLVISVSYDVDDSGLQKAMSSLDSLSKKAQEVGNAISHAMQSGSSDAHSFGSSLGSVNSELNSVLDAAQATGEALATAFAIDKIKQFATGCIGVAQNLELVNRRFGIVMGGADSDLAKQYDEVVQNIADGTMRTAGSIKTYVADAQNVLYGLVAASEEATRDDTAKVAARMTEVSMALATMNGVSDDVTVDRMQKAVLLGQSRSAQMLYAPLKDSTLKMGMADLEKNGEMDFGGRKFKELSEYEKVLVRLRTIELQSVDAIEQQKKLMESSTVGLQKQLYKAQANFRALIGKALLPLSRWFMQFRAGVYEFWTKVAGILWDSEKDVSRVQVALDWLNDALDTLNHHLEPVKEFMSKTIKQGKEEFIKFADKLGGVNRVILMIGTAFASFLSLAVLSKWIRLMRKVIVPLLKIPAPLWLAVGAMTALVMAAKDFADWMNGKSNKLGNMFVKMGLNQGVVKQKIIRFFETTITKVKEFGAAILEFGITTFAQFIEAIITHGPSILESFTKIGKALGEIFAAAFRVAKSIGKAFGLDDTGNAVEWIVNALDKAAEYVGQIADIISNNPELAELIVKAILLMKVIRLASGPLTTLLGIVKGLKGIKGLFSGLGALGKIFSTGGATVGGEAAAGGAAAAGVGTTIAAAAGVAAIVATGVGVVKDVADYNQGKDSILQTILDKLGITNDKLDEMLHPKDDRTEEEIAKQQEKTAQREEQANQIMTKLGSLGETISTAAIGIAEFLGLTGIQAWASFKEDFGFLMEWTLGSLNMILDGLATLLQGIVDTLIGIFTLDFGKIIEGISELLGGISGVLIGTISTVLSSIMGILAVITEYIVKFFGGIKKLVDPTAGMSEEEKKAKVKEYDDAIKADQEAAAAALDNLDFIGWASAKWSEYKDGSEKTKYSGWQPKAYYSWEEEQAKKEKAQQRKETEARKKNVEMFTLPQFTPSTTDDMFGVAAGLGALGGLAGSSKVTPATTGLAIGGATNNQNNNYTLNLNNTITNNVSSPEEAGKATNSMTGDWSGYMKTLRANTAQ